MPAWQGLWNQEANSQVGYAILVNKMPRRYAIKRVVNRDGFRAITELFDTLIGAAAGGAALATHSRVKRPTDTGVGGSGGLMAIETVTDINRVTVAADVTKLKEMVFGVKTAPTYPSVNKAINPR